LQSVLLALSRLPDDVRWAALSALEAHEVARLAHTWEGWARDGPAARPATTASGTPWRTVDHATGIRPPSSPATSRHRVPPSTAGFEFDVPSVFDSDRLEIQRAGRPPRRHPLHPIVSRIRL
jgi:hypothetical protein